MKNDVFWDLTQCGSCKNRVKTDEDDEIYHRRVVRLPKAKSSRIYACICSHKVAESCPYILHVVTAPLVKSVRFALLLMRRWHASKLA
jgi:hypothetical protein